VYPVSRVMNRIASIALFVMMVLTMVDVFGRKVFSHSIHGAVELTEFLLVILIFFSLAQTEVRNGHVQIDLILSKFGKRVQGVVNAITQLSGSVLCGLITWSTFLYAEKMRLSGEVSQDLWIPKFPFVYVVALGCGILAFTLLVNFFTSLSKVVKS